MARFEEKLDATNAASARIEAQLADHIKDSKADQAELAASINSTVANFIEEVKTQNAEAAKLYKEQFAGKWLETFVVRAGWIIITPVLGGTAYFVYKLVAHVMTTPK